MLLVVTSEQMQAVEKRGINKYGLLISALMEAAGLKIAESVMAILGGVEDPEVAVICGKGNNGGDGLVAAKYLTAHGISNSVWVIGSKKSLSGETLANWQILKDTQPKTLRFITKAEGLDLSGYDVVVDAMLGTGASGELREPMNGIVAHINSLACKVVAVDMPTGVNSDNGRAFDNAIRADVTVTMGMRKLGQIFSPGRELCGDVRVEQIGFPAVMYQDESINTFVPESKDVLYLNPPPAVDAYKHQAGKVLAVGGSEGMTGAITLASRAALSLGCGLVITAVPKSLNEIFEIKLTEEMTLPLPDNSKGYLGVESSSELKEHLEWADAMVIGPGLGSNPDTEEFVIKVAERARIPMVIDADALRVFKERELLLAQLGDSAVLTPHHSEFAETFGQPIEMVKSDPVSFARETAVKYGIILVLKGAPTVTATPDGKAYVNPTGNPGMATAGSGDVLAGMIASLIAQGLTPKDAAISGAYMHGLAGDSAADEMGEKSVTASDIIRRFPAMYRRL